MSGMRCEREVFFVARCSLCVYKKYDLLKMCCHIGYMVIHPMTQPSGINAYSALEQKGSKMHKQMVAAHVAMLYIFGE